ncbi:hypothetical protein JQ596_38975 [Bradyrhizobium manausense]|uniref:hypothetical protein n=1 Tax=Bradyrhizobium TaxID=374 RepID=UPI001BAD6F44|nr:MULTISPECIES: hypothetical protein [Bradyrhizobium]MBR0831506.1 hypothetical protein [Bradyrhizobium manausense]UVO27097.1 hypothetical protein KUF59_31910 [Bradyrhizobium arachidis]
MSDLNPSEKHPSQDQDASLAEKLKSQVGGAGAEMRHRAEEALRASVDTARDKAKEAADAAKGVASGALDQVQDQAQQKQYSGADFIQRFSDDIREAARAFEIDAPFATKGINSAADYVQGAGEKIRDGNFRDLVDNATDFAKRQPAAFLGLSVLAGFAAVRFLRATEGGASSSKRRTGEHGSGETEAGAGGPSASRERQSTEASPSFTE